MAQTAAAAAAAAAIAAGVAGVVGSGASGVGVALLHGHVERTPPAAAQKTLAASRRLPADGRPAPVSLLAQPGHVDQGRSIWTNSN